MSQDPREERAVDYPLAVPFTYGAGGNTEDARFVRLFPPTPSNSDECAFLKQALFQAVAEQDDGAEDDREERKRDDDELPDPRALVGAIAASRSADYPKVLKVAKKLFASGIAKVDGEAKLTANTINEKMDQTDFELLLGTFLANFTLARNS